MEPNFLDWMEQNFILYLIMCLSTVAMVGQYGAELIV